MSARVVALSRKVAVVAWPPAVILTLMSLASAIEARRLLSRPEVHTAERRPGHSRTPSKTQTVRSSSRWASQSVRLGLGGAILPSMKVEEIAEAIAKLPSDQLARFRRWFNAFEAGRADHAKELNSTATKLGRLAGRAFAELKKRANEP